MNSNDSIILDYITSQYNIMHSMLTHIFICGANYDIQQLQTNGRILAFRSSENLGIHRAASASMYTVTEQGILIAKTPFMTTSILIVADNSDIVVSCFHETINKTLRSNKKRVQEEQSPSITPPVTSTPISSLKRIIKTDPMTTIEDKRETMLVRITGKPVPVVKLLTVSMIMIFVVVCISIIIGAAAYLFCKLYGGMRATQVT